MQIWFYVTRCGDIHHWKLCLHPNTVEVNLLCGAHSFKKKGVHSVESTVVPMKTVHIVVFELSRVIDRQILMLMKLHLSLLYLYEAEISEMNSSNWSAWLDTTRHKWKNMFLFCMIWVNWTFKDCFSNNLPRICPLCTASVSNLSSVLVCLKGNNRTGWSRSAMITFVRY